MAWIKIEPRSSRPAWLVVCCIGVLVVLATAMTLRPTTGLQAYQKRARPELILGTDKITPRKAQMLRMGLLKMSHTFCAPADLAASTPAAQALWGGVCPPPHAERLSQPMPPSTALLPDLGTTPEGVTVVSIVCASEDLFHPEHGIVMHPLKRGRESEREAWISARLGNAKLLESPIGLRIHGGHSRGSPEKSFTAVFRENYSGHRQCPPDLFFGPGTPSARQFILLNAGHSSRFNGALAVEIATLAGCNTSRFTPAIVYLNGTRLKSPYFLYQQQSPEFISGRFGIEQPDWYRLKGLNLQVSERFKALRRWIRSAPVPLSLQDAARHYDIEDLNNWVLAIAFTSTTDNNQGSYFIDAADPAARWRSLTWDMDCAFNDLTHKTESGWIDYSRDPFTALDGYRAELFLRLFHESTEYRMHFMAHARRKLANELHRDKLVAIADRYIRLSSTLTSSDSATTRIMHDTKEFLLSRHPIFLSYLERKEKEATTRALAGEGAM